MTTTRTFYMLTLTATLAVAKVLPSSRSLSDEELVDQVVGFLNDTTDLAEDAMDLSAEAESLGNQAEDLGDKA